MAESPSPYAPGIIGDEPAPPRPAGRASLFLVAQFVMTLAASQVVFFDWAETRDFGGDDPAVLATLGWIGFAPELLRWLWAYLSDRVPLWGTRREGYVLFAALIAMLTWIALALAGHFETTWFVAAGLLGFAAAVSGAVTLGGLAEIGQRRRATGRLAAASIGVVQLAVMGTSLASPELTSLWTTAGVAAGLSLALILLFVVRGDDTDPPTVPDASPERPSILRFLRSRAFWSSAALSALAGAAVSPRGLFRGGGATETFGPGWSVNAAIGVDVLLIAALYLLCCRRVRFGVLLRATLAIKVVALIVHLRAGSPATHLMHGAANSLLSVALCHLVLRTAPRGREAFGAGVLGSVTAVIAFVVDQIETVTQMSVARGVWFAAAAGLLAALAVSLLPKAITETADGQVLGSPP